MSLRMSRAAVNARPSWRTSLTHQHHLHSMPTTPPAPPLLFKLRADLKTAMQQKDKSRLNVLRGLIAEVTNAAKSSNPIKTDMQLLSLLRKRAAASKAASSEFKSAGREDLVQNEEQQAAVLEEYAGGVEVMSEQDMRAAVANAVEEMGEGAQAGLVLKKLFGPSGALDGKPVEKGEVARIVKEMVKR